MSIDRWIARNAVAWPDRPAVGDERQSLTYGRLEERVADAAGLLRELGVGRGDRVAHLGLNSVDMLVLLFAAARLGAIFLPLNWRLAPPELAYALRDSGARILFHDRDFDEAVSAIRRSVSSFDALVIDDETHAGFPARLNVAEPVRESVLAEDEDAPVLVVYTSGTTGRPKGAVLGHRALEANARMSLDMHAMTEEDHVLTVLPMFHVGGLNIQTTPALFCGARVTLQARFHPDAFLQAVARARPTLTVLVPATMKAVIAADAFPEADLSGLRAIASGSSAVAQPLIDAFEARGVPVILVYGATETAPICVYQRVETRKALPGGTGRAGTLAELRIVDPDGRDAEAGDPGEIWIRGPATLSAYWNNEAATAEAIVEGGWFRTGDIGFVDRAGELSVVDRLKNVIISGGENIYPAELERVLDACPQLAEAAVVPRPDERWQEVPVAVVVPKPGSRLDREAVLALFEGELARFKHPRDVVFVESLPRNVMGKVQHFELRALVADSGAAMKEEGLPREAGDPVEGKIRR